MQSFVGGQVRESATPVLETSRLRLTIPGLGDSRQLLDYALRNQDHMAPWSPPAPPDWNTMDNAERRARQYREQALAGTCFRFWARLRDAPEGDYIGAVTLSQIMFGPRRSCSLGYHVDALHEGRGYVLEAARAVVEFAFRRLLLHRVEATYVPQNERSARVLERLGFVIEGHARGYLFVGGRFQDHVLTGLVNTELGDATALCTPSA
jgi:[ribosomal protein S5]-alanine N-acetyltransferase